MYWDRETHSSTLIGWLSAAVIFGVLISVVADGYFASISWLISAVVLVIIGFLKSKIWCVMFVVVAGLIIGLWRGSVLVLELSKAERYVGSSIAIKGKVAEDVVAGKHGGQVIVLQDISLNQKNLPGKIWLSTQNKELIKRSDTLVVRGLLDEKFGGFTATMNNVEIIEHTRGDDAARDVRDSFASNVRHTINEPEASLGIGFLVGQRSSLPSDLDNQLRIAGLTHIVVASGYNLTILLRASRRIFARISKYLTALFGGGMIIGFIMVTGFSPSMSRAGLVAALSLAAWYYGRKFSPFVLLPFVAMLTVILNPSYVWGDIGWYLSFSAFIGVMIGAPLIQDYFFGADKPSFIRQIAGETIAALIITLPIILLVFEQFSLYALLSNLLVVPLVPLAMAGVFIAGISNIILPVIAQLLALPAEVILGYMTWIVGWVNSLPNANIAASISWWQIGIYYSIFGLMLFYMWHKTKHNFRDDNLVE